MLAPISDSPLLLSFMNPLTVNFWPEAVQILMNRNVNAMKDSLFTGLALDYQLVNRMVRSDLIRQSQQ